MNGFLPSVSHTIVTFAVVNPASESYTFTAVVPERVYGRINVAGAAPAFDCMAVILQLSPDSKAGAGVSARVTLLIVPALVLEIGMLNWVSSVSPSESTRGLLVAPVSQAFPTLTSQSGKLPSE